MEKKQYKDFFIPFAPAKLIKSPELLESMLEPAGDYNKLDESQRALILLFSKIFQTGENLIGTSFSFQGGDINYPLPQKWTPVMNYLKENKLIQNIFFEPLYYDEPKMVRAIFISSSDADLTDGRKPSSENYTHGDSLDFEEAISKVIGEFLERYPLLIYKEKNLLRASCDDLRRKNKFYLDINHLAGFSKEQNARNEHFQFSDANDFLWEEGRLLFGNKPCLIPAQLIFWNYNINHQNWREPLLRESNTNGAGGHYTLGKAILAGIYEIIQRDGFLIYWFNKQAPPQIDSKTIDYEPLKNLLNECSRLNLEVHFYNTTTDLKIPSCICTVFDHTGIGPKVTMGGGCEMNWDKMLLRAISETLGVYHWSRKRRENGEEYPSLDKNYIPFQDNSMGQLKRLYLWANEEMFEQFQFFLKGKIQSLKELKKESPSFSSSEEELNYLIEKFKSMGQGYEIFYYQAGHKALDDLGYFSVKVIIPALVHFFIREIFAPLGAKRLKEVPKKLGFEAAKEWNPLPHPFP